MEESEFGTRQGNIMTSNLQELCPKIGARTLWGANGTSPFIEAGGHCNARDYVDNLGQAGVQNLKSLTLKFVDDNCPIHRAKIVDQWKRDNGVCRVPCQDCAA